MRESISVRSSSSAALREQMVTFIDKMRENGADTEAEIVERYMEAAEQEGVTLTRDEVMDELAADFAGDMLDDADLFAKFSKENRTAAQKLLDSLKEFLAKVKTAFTGKYRDMAAQEAYGKDFAELEDIAKQWQAAFDAAERQAEKTKTAAGEGDGRMMLKDYSYDALVRKPDMTLAVVENADRLTRKEVVDKALAEAKKYGGVNQNGNVYVHVNDTDADVIISAKVLRHGLDRRFTVNAPATLKVGEILQNAVRINELVPKLDTIDATYVLMGVAKKQKQRTVHRTVRCKSCLQRGHVRGCSVCDKRKKRTGCIAAKVHGRIRSSNRFHYQYSRFAYVCQSVFSGRAAGECSAAFRPQRGTGGQTGRGCDGRDRRGAV